LDTPSYVFTVTHYLVRSEILSYILGVTTWKWLRNVALLYLKMWSQYHI